MMLLIPISACLWLLAGCSFISLWLHLISAACLNSHLQPVIVGAGFSWPGAGPASGCPISGNWSG